MNTLKTLVLSLALCVPFAACEDDDGPLEETGENIEEAVTPDENILEEAGGELEEVGEDISDNVDEATE